MGKSQVGHVTQSLSYFQAKTFIIQNFFLGILVYDNDYSLIIDIYFYETFSISSQNLAFNSLDTLSDVRIKAFTLLF